MLRFVLTVLLLYCFAIPAVGQSHEASPSTPDSAATAVETDPHWKDDEADDWAPVRAAVEASDDDWVGAPDESDVLYGRSSPVYRAAPPLRYNRVEGFVLGLQRDPLALGDDDRTRVFGQLAYATQLRDLRYTVGAESQLYHDGPTGLKLGVLYQEQTLTPDRWKTSYLENSLAGATVRQDFFDYYEAQGVTIYGVQALPHSFRLTAGLRAEEHRALDVETSWSLFGEDSFRPNPAADEGRLHAVFASLSGGRVRDLDDLPVGQAVQVSATVANGMGGDFSFARYEADGRVYLPLTTDTRLAVRLRGGYATAGAPLQSQFTLGGIGSVRSYDQNAFRGTRMLLANAEYLIDGATIIDGLLDDLYVGGIADAGWVGGPEDRVNLSDVRPSAGFSVGLDERQVRLDVTWPLRDGPETGSSPSIWLRITPNF